MKQALVMAANHISFAATSDDASINVQKSAPVFRGDISRVMERCELIDLLGKDVEASSTVAEAQVSVAGDQQARAGESDGRRCGWQRHGRRHARGVRPDAAPQGSRSHGGARESDVT